MRDNNSKVKLNGAVLSAEIAGVDIGVRVCDKNPKIRITSPTMSVYDSSDIVCIMEGGDIRRVDVKIRKHKFDTLFINKDKLNTNDFIIVAYVDSSLVCIYDCTYALSYGFENNICRKSLNSSIVFEVPKCACVASYTFKELGIELEFV